MKVQKAENGQQIVIQLCQNEDEYYLTTYQARWEKGLTSASMSLFISPDKAEELLHNLINILVE